MVNSTDVNDNFDSSLRIAIIGMAARFPGAKDVDAFWQNLCAGKETIHRFTDEELREAGVSQTELEDPNYVKAAPILEDIDLFDASFFGYTPMEATFMDPQQRLILECCWQALEHAGYTGERVSDAVGVYVGIKMNTYLTDFIAHAHLFDAADRVQIMMGNAEFALGTRISYKLNLKGPSYMIQTACSTSLAAVHLACQALLLDECRLALAGAGAVEVPHRAGYPYQYGGPASPDGHCRPFDAQAQGTVFGSGVGVVALKRLADALADGDQVYAVIKGTAVNNDGALKASFTAPSVEGQTQVILEALACANVDVDTISYVETHGTGTPLGDPIEMAALSNAFRAGTSKTGFCRIGSVKSNVGHLDAAAGMAGLIKTVLALQHKQLPPSLHFAAPNPEIDFEHSPFVVNTKLTPWQGVPLPRRAGVSSFGFGGTNTHVILEEAPAITPAGVSRPWGLLLLSAKTGTALEAATANLAAHLKQCPDLNPSGRASGRSLADVAYTLQVGRPAFKQRRALVCRNLADAVDLLETPQNPRVRTAVQETGDRPVVFMFSGQGTQYVNMGRELYQAEPVFREQVDGCAELLAPHLSFDLRTVLYPDPSEVAAATQKLTQTAVTQPALFAIEYALARLWQAWGVVPQALIGHSIGEYVAACLAGVFSLPDGLALVAARGRLMQGMPPGAMLAVPLPEQEIQPLLDGHLALAGVNAPARCVVAGPIEAIEKLERRLAGQDVACRSLHTSHAFHSAMMDPILEPFMELVRGVSLHPPQIPYMSNVSGAWINAAQATDPAYWADHLRQPVRFADGISALTEDAGRVLLEVGPGRTLSTLARRCLSQSAGGAIFSSLRHPRDEQSDVAFLLNTLSELWLAGVNVDWAGFYAGERRHRVPLPTYPFERRRYWFEPPRREKARTPGARATKTPDVADWFYLPSWKRSLPPVQEREEAGAPPCWLLFVDACDLGARLADRLEAAGQDVVVVRSGGAFSRLSDGEFSLRPGRPDDYDALLDAVDKLGKRPETSVHLWNVTREQAGAPTLEGFDEAQARGFYSLLYLAQALGKQDWADPLQIVVVSNGLQDVTGEQELNPAKATLLGPVRVIPLEYPHVRCRSVDVVLPPTGIDPQLVDLLLAEVAAPSEDGVVAYRRSHRWVQTFEPVRLEKTQAPSNLREGGVYLITGGLGGIGLVLARHLAETVRARLVLTGRSAFPAPDEREAWLSTHGEADGTSRKIRQVRELEELGAQVLVASADVADLGQMQAVVALAQRRFGAVHGVIHAAGVPGGGIIQLKTPEMAAGVLAPKVQGALVLKALFKDAPLDFLALFSSLSAILGEFGQVDYCAANAFLDALACQNPWGHNGRTLSINWDMWREVGMTVQTGVPGLLQEWREQQLELAMLSCEGVEVFERVLSQSATPRLSVCTTDIDAKIEQFRALTRSRILGEVEQLSYSLPSAGVAHPRPDLRTPYLAPSSATERMIADIWQSVLGIERVGIHDNFFDLGGDSLIGLKLIAQLKRELGIEVPAVDLYKGPTVSRLAGLIDQATGQAQEAESAHEAGRDRGARRRQRRQQLLRTE